MSKPSEYGIKEKGNKLFILSNIHKYEIKLKTIPIQPFISLILRCELY
jgi:hypothetical protein